MFTGIVYAAGINSRMRGALDVPFKGMLPVYGSKSLITCQIERLFGIGSVWQESLSVVREWDLIWSIQSWMR